MGRADRRMMTAVSRRPARGQLPPGEPPDVTPETEILEDSDILVEDAETLIEG